MSTRSESQALLDNAIDVLEALKSTPEDAPFERVIQLGLLAGEIERLGHKDIADMLTVLALAVAPVDDHATRPIGLPTLATHLIETAQTKLRVVAAGYVTS